MDEPLSLMREAWVKSMATPTKALEQGLDLYLLPGPHLNGALVCLNIELIYCKTCSYVGGGGSIVHSIWSVIKENHNYITLRTQQNFETYAVPTSLHISSSEPFAYIHNAVKSVLETHL